MTIVEAVVALFVFGLFMASACKLMIVARESSRRAQDHYAAINVAKSRIERIQGFDFFVLDQCVETRKPKNQDGSDCDFDSAMFLSSTAISNVTPNLKWVRIDIEIKDRVTLEFDGEREEIVTYISQPRTLDEIM
jgi:hypothetical protein